MNTFLDRSRQACQETMRRLLQAANGRSRPALIACAAIGVVALGVAQFLFDPVVPWPFTAAAISCAAAIAATCARSAWRDRRFEA